MDSGHYILVWIAAGSPVSADKKPPDRQISHRLVGAAGARFSRCSCDFTGLARATARVDPLRIGGRVVVYTQTGGRITARP